MTKDLCTYHQTRHAIWLCDDCARHFCAQCVVLIHGQRPTGPACPLCEKPLAYIGNRASAEPFWSVLHRFFLYPLSISGGVLMLLVGLLSLATPYGFVGLFASLLAVAALLKYCFAVLESVASGSSAAPSLLEAATGDEDHLFIQLVGMLMVIALIEALTEILISPAIGAVCVVLFTLVTPAMVMLLALTREIGAALSVQRIYDLAVKIGWPYLLVVGLTNVIATGPYLLARTFADALSATPVVLPILASVIAYLAVVNFAMLGYLLFEHQGSLAWRTDEPDDERLPATLDNLRKQLMGTVNVLAAEGHKGDALQRLESGRKEFAEDMVYHQRYFDFARQCDDALGIARASEPYIALLVRRGAVDQALAVWHDAVALAPAYKPKNPAIAHTLARRAHASNRLNEALALLVNLHKRAPRYPALGAAYQLAATILRQLGDPAKAVQIEKFIGAFLQKRDLQKRDNAQTTARRRRAAGAAR